MSQGAVDGVPQAEQVAMALVAVDGKLYWREPALLAASDGNRLLVSLVAIGDLLVAAL